ncbi:class III lanthionine synthetase LanKC [Streptomyces sp. enrichment culture]|uniref:class III lanthionine synthetase LanKC n=1 Tax=Streptomyces sp. enrichment culture TaxID=1795815 RepID=UPI003F563E9C
MSLRHIAYCPPGTVYFDKPTAGPAGGEEYPLVGATLPEGWTRSQISEWTCIGPPQPDIPLQGWKIHVSATLESADEVLDIVRDYCFAHPMMFKFLTSPTMLMLRNSKYGDRGSSGKFITMYPRDEEHLATVLHELGALLEGRDGPYILSDLRWRSGPLYVRYGGFAARLSRQPGGETVHCIEDPEGRLVPDVRGPSFKPPAWVELPGVVREALAERARGGGLGDFPFRITQALHFSNGGGVYKATDTRDGREVLVKEGRPHAGLDQSGDDAVTRLQREHDAMIALEGLDAFPKVLDYRRGSQHWFLTREYVDGKQLGGEMVRLNPVVHSATDRSETLDPAAYTAWALDVLDRIEAAVATMHERGLVFGDLHPNNVLIRPDGTVAFIDLETTRPAEGHSGQAMGAPGYCAPAGTTGTDVDRYALGCLRLSVFLPLTTLMPWDPAKAEQLIELVRERFPVPADFADRVRAELSLEAAGPEPAEPLWPVPAAGPDGFADAGELAALAGRVADGILATATPEREDRLFPGDIEQFSHPGGGLSVAHGAAGVLWALHGAGRDVPGEYVDWLADAARTVDQPRPGLYDGLSGIACALHALGRTAEAAELLDRAVDLPRDEAGDSLHSGTAGLGLALLELGRTEEARVLAVSLAERIGLGAGDIPADGPSAQDAQQDRRDRRHLPGLLHGGAGQALFLLRVAALLPGDGAEALVDTAARILRHDLVASGRLPGGPEVLEQAPWRGPHIACGSAGQAIVLHELLRHREDAGLRAVYEDMRTDLTTDYHPGIGLFTGRAGAMAALLHTHDGGERALATLHAQLAGLGWHAVPHDGTLAFLGEHSLRLSTDLATGSAGVLAVLSSLGTDRRAALPFLGLAGVAAPVG